ncbi:MULTISPECIES: AraC family transcriptional regulator [Alphaproteobacteria]|uniref:helix-turn-helix transcriptional regulator n=1 Tax=Alphaproteobacteria TaxID=28211 RepID=UPI003266B745
MDLTPPRHRFGADPRLFSRADDQNEGGWKEQFRCDEIGEECRVGVVDCLVTEDQTHMVEGPPVFSVSLFLQGTGCFEVEDGPSFEFGAGSMFLFLTKAATRGRDRMYANTRLRGAEFRFSIPVLRRIGLVRSLEIGSRDDHLGGPSSVSLFMHRPLTGALRLIAEQAVGCRLEGMPRRLYLRAKALEVLAHVASMCEASKSIPESVNARDRRRIEAAADTLCTRYDEPWTIARLAAETGINERKLKSGFRLVLGQTIHNRLESARVEAAQKLLKDEGFNVAEAAFAVGYSNPSHFAKVFRRVSGESPGHWRKQPT